MRNFARLPRFVSIPTRVHAPPPDYRICSRPFSLLAALRIRPLKSEKVRGAKRIGIADGRSVEASTGLLCEDATRKMFLDLYLQIAPLFCPTARATLQAHVASLAPPRDRPTAVGCGDDGGSLA